MCFTSVSLRGLVAPSQHLFLSPISVAVAESLTSSPLGMLLVWLGIVFVVAARMYPTRGEDELGDVWVPVALWTLFGVVFVRPWYRYSRLVST